MIETFLLIVNLLVALALVGVILMQRSEGGGLGMGGGNSSGGMGGFMSARGATNFLTRTTAILAIVFMALSMILAVMGQGRRQTSPFETPVGVVAAELGADGRSTIANVPSYRHAKAVALGEAERNRWDYLALVYYPSVNAFIDMMTSTDYEARCDPHRTNGCEEHVIICTKEAYSKFKI